MTKYIRWCLAEEAEMRVCYVTLFLKDGQRSLKTYASVSCSTMKMGEMTITVAAVPCDSWLGGGGDIWGKENVSEAEEKSSVGNHPSAVATLKHLPVTFYPHESGTWTVVLLSFLGKASVQGTHWVAWKSWNLPPFNPVGCFLWFSMMLWGVWWKDTPQKVSSKSKFYWPCWFEEHLPLPLVSCFWILLSHWWHCLGRFTRWSFGRKFVTMVGFEGL